MSSKDHAIIKAEYADYRTVKGRKVLQIICEVPREQAPEVHRALGEPGLPDNQIWVAIALLKEQPKDWQNKDAKSPPPVEKKEGKERRSWDQLSAREQAVLRCKEPTFWAFIRDTDRAVYVTNEEAVASWIKVVCGVKSRSDLTDNGPAWRAWKKIEGDYQAYLTEHQYTDNLARERDMKGAEKETTRDC